MSATTDSDSVAQGPRRCARCGDTDVLFVEAIRGNFGSGNVIPLSGWFIFSSIKVDRYVCMACGFCEEWITNPDDREQLRRWYRPGSRRVRNNDRWRRWGQWVARVKTRLLGFASAVMRPHDEVQS